MCSPEQAQRIAQAPNAEAIRKRKTGQIVQVNLRSVEDDCGRRPSASVGPVYAEHLEYGSVTVLAIYDETEGRLRRWDHSDGFNPRRFNPDSIPESAVGMGLLISRRPSWSAADASSGDAVTVQAGAGQ